MSGQIRATGGEETALEKGSRFLNGAAAAGGRLLDSRAGTRVLDLASALTYRDYLRAPLLKLADRGLRSALESDGARRAGSGRLTRERIMWVRAVLHALDRAVRQGVVSPHVIRVQTRILARRLPFASNVSPGRKEFRRRYGCDPPWMIVVSPGHACNMQCAGCYASSEDSAEKLPWHVLDEVVRQANELWGVGLVVISAGRARGYLYIDWDGKVMPCVFAPYAACNVQDVFARGGNLNDVSFVPGTSVSFAGRSQVEDHVW